MTLSEATGAVAKMLQGSPHRQDHIGDGYIGVLAAVLMEYPRQVALACANPVTGAMRELKFLPTIPDIVAWCERKTELLRTPLDLADEDERKARKRREEAEEAKRWEECRSRRPTLEELKARYGPNWGIPNPDGRPTPPTREQCRAKLIAQVGQEAFDAIPDQGSTWSKLHGYVPAQQQEAAE